MLIRELHLRIRHRWLRFKLWLNHKQGKRLDIKMGGREWHRWTPEELKFKIEYLDEDRWWNEFIPFVMKKYYEPMANKSIRQKVGRWFFKQKVLHFLRGWTGYDAADQQTIWIRDSKFHPVTLLHEIGHVMCIDHYWTPGIMNPVWFFRWF